MRRLYYEKSVTEILQRPFLQPRQRPVDFQRPRNVFVNCNDYILQHPINYGVFKGIFNRLGRANKIDPNPPGPRNNPSIPGYRKPTNSYKNTEILFNPKDNNHRGSTMGRICLDNCLGTGKRRKGCKRLCRCRSICLERGQSFVTCRRRCRKRH